eukprot:1158269-Pelagomonas_calceolata.AAC.7
MANMLGTMRCKEGTGQSRCASTQACTHACTGPSKHARCKAAGKEANMQHQRHASLVLGFAALRFSCQVLQEGEKSRPLVCA